MKDSKQIIEDIINNNPKVHFTKSTNIDPDFPDMSWNELYIADECVVCLVGDDDHFYEDDEIEELLKSVVNPRIKKLWK